MQYINMGTSNNPRWVSRVFRGSRMLLQGVTKFFTLTIWGFPYDEQAKKLGDWDVRGEDNPKTDRVVYRANKVSMSWNYYL